MGTVWKDAQGKEWDANISIATANGLRSGHDIDLLKQKSIERIWNDPYYWIELAAKVHHKQIENAGINEGDFAELATQTESVACAAYDALIAALVNFLRVMRQSALAELVEASTAAAKEADDKARSMIQKDMKEITDRSVKKATDAVAKAIEEAKK